MSLAHSKIVVVGGSSGIGLAIARAARQEGAQVLIAGSDAARLKLAVMQVSGLETAVLDIRKEEQIADFFSGMADLDHVVVTASVSLASSPLAALDLAQVDNAIRVKLLGSLLVAKHAASRLRAGGSIGLTSGVLGRKPAINSIVKTIINAGLEAAVKQLAKELAPLRVYAVSPGPVNTPSWNFTDEAARAAAFERMRHSLPLGMLASAEDTAAAYLFAMQAHALTGTVIDLDSGALVA